MPYEPTHASFFSGVGGLDLGLERAGWRTVSFSEIDPYASAVLAERWPGVPNLGDIVDLAARWTAADGDGRRRDVADRPQARDEAGRLDRSGHSGGWIQPRHYESSRDGSGDGDPDWTRASLWSGGFPCQDLSVAGKRAGFAGERSSLAFAFLDLVERHRPPAILLENVPGLLSSHRGRDFGALLDRLAQLGYGWAYRILDARHFGVPQRRRRVFIVALDTERGLGAERAAEVLSVGTRCPRHPATGHATGAGVAERLGDRAYLPQSVSAKWSKQAGGPAGDEHHNLTLSASPDPGGVRTADGLAGRLDGGDGLAPTLRVGPRRIEDGGPGDTVPLTVDALSAHQGGSDVKHAQAGHIFVKSARAQSNQDDESWRAGDVMPTLNAFDVGDTRTTAAIIEAGREEAESARPRDATDDLLPLGLDSHRYRCCGNGVVSSVAEWIGLRLAGALA